jgi:hypothetical protein
VPAPERDLDTRNRRVARVLLGLVLALVTMWVWVGTRW